MYQTYRLAMALGVGIGLISVIDCRDPQQTADIMTKPLPQPKFVRHVNELGLSDTSAV